MFIAAAIIGSCRYSKPAVTLTNCNVTLVTAGMRHAGITTWLNATISTNAYWHSTINVYRSYSCSTY